MSQLFVRYHESVACLSCRDISTRHSFTAARTGGRGATCCRAVRSGFFITFLIFLGPRQRGSRQLVAEESANAKM